MIRNISYAIYNIGFGLSGDIKRLRNSFRTSKHYSSLHFGIDLKDAWQNIKCDTLKYARFFRNYIHMELHF